MKRKIHWVGIALFIILIACAPRVVYMPVEKHPLPPKAAEEAIPVYTATNPPPHPYRVIGILMVDEEVDVFNFTRLTDSKIIKRLQAEARKHGADAILVGEMHSQMDIVPESNQTASAQLRLTKHAGAYAIVWDTSNNH